MADDTWIDLLNLNMTIESKGQSGERVEIYIVPSDLVVMAFRRRDVHSSFSLGSAGDACVLNICSHTI